MQTTFYGLQFFYEEEVEYPAGHTLLLEGRKQNHLYVLRKGVVEISMGGQRLAAPQAVEPGDLLELGDSRLEIGI